MKIIISQQEPIVPLMIIIFKMKVKEIRTLTMIINFISSKDSDETRTMHIKSNNIEIMMGNEAGKVIEELFESLLQRYKEGLEE